MTILKKIVKCMTMVILYLVTNISYAQVIDLQTAGPNRWGRVNPVPGFNASAIGVGNFTTSPFSALHINTNLLPANTNFTPAEVFRTDCPAGGASFWRMLKGGAAFARLWSPAGSNNFIIENQNPISGHILFNTNGVTRMIVTDGAPFPLAGNVGIGFNFLTPQSLLHQDAGGDNYHQFTNTATGNTTPIDGFRTGITGTGIAELRQEENLPMDFLTNQSGTPTRRMRVFHDAADNTRVGIGKDVTTPLTHLHIGMDALPASGYRTWMDKGVLMYGAPLFSGSNIGTDEMYVGIRELSNNKADAIINWGNDPTTDPTHTDRLRFVFTQYQGSSPATPAIGNDGLEITRMISDGFNGYIGLGGDGYSVNPPFPTPYNPYSANAGIDPGNTVEINSPLPIPSGAPAISVPVNSTTGYNVASPVAGYAPATGWSGLRFTDLTAKSTSVPTGTAGTTTNVLSVDDNGDVILVPGGGTGGAFFNTCSPGPLPLLPGDAGTNLNNHNFVFQDNGIGSNNTTINNVGIGLAPTNCSPQAKLEILQSSGNTNPNISPTGILINNTDINPASNNNTYIAPMGIKCIMSNATLSFAPYRSIAGWFEVPGSVPGVFNGRAIIVPPFGGSVGIWQTAPNWILELGFASAAMPGGGPWLSSSDRRVKKDTTAFTDGLNVIRNVHPVNYRYNGKAGIKDTSAFIGVIAQDIQPFAPYTVKTYKGKLDSTNAEKIDLLSFNSGPLLYASINAIKQLDSAVTAIQNNPGITGSGTQNYLTKWSGANTVTASSVFDDGTHLGIGTTNTSAKVYIDDSNTNFASTSLRVQGHGTQTGWKGRIIAGGDNVAFVMGEFKTGNGLTQCWLGGHNAALTAWAPLHINPNDGTDLYLGNLLGGGEGNAPLITIQNVGGNIGVGISSNPQNQLDVVRGAKGTMFKGTYESASIERNGDTKMGVYSSSTSPSDGASLAFGFTNLTQNTGLYPGFELQELYSSNASQNIMRFNAISRTAGGSVVSATPNILNILGNGNIGIGTSNPSERLHVIGNILATGTITQNSDAALKQNVDSIGNALQIISQLNPHSFNFDTAQYSYMGLPSGKQYGIIAQEAETVLPEIVKESVFPEMKDYAGNPLNPETHFKTVNYTALVPILIKAVQEQQSKINMLESNLNTCCSSNTKTTENNNAQSDIEKIKLTLPDAPVLGNVRPNPNSGYAEIPYYIPENSGNAKIIFIDMLGRAMQEKILTAGYGIIGIDTADLPSGTYSYSMILNGKTLDTKTMIKTK